MAGLNESLGSLFNIEKLPYYRPGVQARYEGSIDKTSCSATLLKAHLCKLSGD